jgi:integrase
VKVPSGVQRRGSVFWLRVTVPNDIRHLYPRTSSGKLRTTHSSVSLETSDPTEASIRALRRRADIESEFVSKRELAQLESRPPEVIPTAELAASLALYVRSQILETDDSVRFDPQALQSLLATFEVVAPPLRFMTAGTIPSYLQDDPSWPPGNGIRPDQFKRLSDIHATVARLHSKELATGTLVLSRIYAEDACKALGLRVNWDRPENRAALVTVLRSAVSAWVDRGRRDCGEVVETPTPPAKPETVAKAVPPKPVYLSDVVTDWVSKRQPKADALKRTRLAIRRLAESGMDKPITQYKRVDGARLRDWLRHPDRGIKHKTGKNIWTALGALMNIAVEYGQLERNPWVKLDFDVLDSDKREEFTSEELGVLFGSQLFQAGSYRTIYRVDAWDAYFMLLLGLWTGARIGEPAQLELVDLQVQNGLQVMLFHDEAEGSRMKNPEMARPLPVPPEMVRLGFLDFVSAKRQAGEVKLFPSLHRPGKRGPGDVMTEWMRQYRADLALPAGPLEGFHKFRHTVRTALASHNVNAEIGDQLTGHTTKGSTGSKVYTHVRPPTILQALELPLFPFLNLQRVYPVPTDRQPSLSAD